MSLHAFTLASQCVSACTAMCRHFAPDGVKWPTPAGDLQRASLSSGEARTGSEGRDETENRGVSLRPQTLLFQAFLIIPKNKGTMQSTDTCLGQKLRAPQSALSATGEKNERAERQRGE